MKDSTAYCRLLASFFIFFASFFSLGLLAGSFFTAFLLSWLLLMMVAPMKKSGVGLHFAVQTSYPISIPQDAINGCAQPSGSRDLPTPRKLFKYPRSLTLTSVMRCYCATTISVRH
jgi:hypothetical protein